ncbi:hypothetical protein B0O99DRAFT_658007 [Bisporella sp. PMI_857]|nr:hypothetical protein B0O99DRAFT_658007 [Bisporella sp. PMI_857]
MATDMDLDIDIDMDLMDDGYPQENQDIAIADDLATESASQIRANAPNDTSTPDALQLCPEKVHLRGLDNLATKDIKAFAAAYYPSHEPEHIQWIDDTSANLVYETPEIAQEALLSFVATEIVDISQLPTLQTIAAKPVPEQKDTQLEVRIAVQGDRKQAGARDRTPQQGGARGGNRRYRERDDDGYRSQRYDDREHRKRRDEDETSGFDASLYDDDEAALAQRANRKRRQDSRSRSNSRERRRVRFGGAGKELFPEKADERRSRLRDRSASPVRGIERDLEADRRYIRQNNAAAENRAKAQAIKAQLQDAGTKELFPDKLGVSHHRSLAFDAADATADLFAKQMPVPFVDGAGSGAIRDSGGKGINIRGVAKPNKSINFDFAIKGGANGGVKELFPSHGGNSGKELFGETLEGRGGRRRKAEDLFH